MPLDPYARNYNFQQEANSGVSDFPMPGKVDTELNDIATVIAQLRARLQMITSADGRLRNVAYSLAQSLVGTWTGTSDGTVTIDTTIPWQATFSVNSMLVVSSSTILRPAQISSVSSNSGNLRVVLTSAPTNGTPLVVWAFEPGNNALTILASDATGDGAARVAIEDAAALFVSASVEDALAEVMTSLNTLITNLGPVGDLFKANGSVPATADFDMAGFRVTGAGDGTDDGDYVTVRQLASYIAAWTDLAQFFLKRDGSTAMAGTLNFGNNKGTNLADADLAAPTDAVNVRTLQSAISTSGAVPVGTVIDYAGASAPTSWLICDGTAYAEADYPALADVLPVAYKSGSAQGAQAAYYPALIAGNLTAGALSSLPSMTNSGTGYTGIPRIEVENKDGGAAVVTQPTFTVSVSASTVDGPNVTGGSLTISILTGGAGIRAGAVIKIINDLRDDPGNPAIAPLPGGYFRVPDMRGRVSIGAGTESRTPGISDPPDVGKGDRYNAVTNAIGGSGGSQSAVGLHSHNLVSDATDINVSYSALTGASTLSRRRNAASDQDYALGENTANPTATLGKSSTAGEADARPPFHVLNKIIKAL